jgi:hypothetical protein
MMIKLATLFPLVLAVGSTVADRSVDGGKGLRGLKSMSSPPQEELANASLEASLLSATDADIMDEFTHGEAVEGVPPFDIQDEGNENDRGERELSTSWCYDFYSGAIRTSNHHDAKGYEGRDYHLYKDKSESWCKSYCSSYSWCKAYEYYHHESRCELWKGWYGYYKGENGFKTYVKKHC